MDLVEIVILVCAIARPDHCEDKHLQFSWQGSLKQCVMAAPPYVARWISEHPQWTVKKYRCEYPHPGDKAEAREGARRA